MLVPHFGGPLDGELRSVVAGISERQSVVVRDKSEENLWHRYTLGVIDNRRFWIYRGATESGVSDER